MISIVVVNWNSGTLLERCVRSLLDHAPDCEITIVDNASADDSLAFADNVGPPLQIIRLSQNAGFAAASNAGWRQSRGNLVLFLNPDTECLADSVRRLSDALGDASVWAVGGKLLDSVQGRHDAGFNVRAFPSVQSTAVELLLLDEIWPTNRWTREYRLSGCRLDQQQDVEQPAAACLMVSRQALDRLGGFDETFFPAWFEDVDLCKRIRQAGGRIRFEPNARFLHRGGYSAERLSREQFLRFFHTNQIRYFAKHYGTRTAERVRKLVVAGMYMRALASVIRPPAAGLTRGASARAHWSAARHFAQLEEQRECPRKS